MAISAQFVVVVLEPTRLHWTSLRNLWLFSFFMLLLLVFYASHGVSVLRLIRL